MFKEVAHRFFPRKFSSDYYSRLGQLCEPSSEKPAHDEVFWEVMRENEAEVRFEEHELRLAAMDLEEFARFREQRPRAILLALSIAAGAAEHRYTQLCQDFRLTSYREYWGDKRLLKEGTFVWEDPEVFQALIAEGNGIYVCLAGSKPTIVNIDVYMSIVMIDLILKNRKVEIVSLLPAELFSHPRGIVTPAEVRHLIYRMNDRRHNYADRIHFVKI